MLFVLCRQMDGPYLGRATVKTTRFNNIFLAQQVFLPDFDSKSSVAPPNSRCLRGIAIQVTGSGRSERREANMSRIPSSEAGESV